MANEVDISELWLLDVCPKAVQALLVDHTTGQNIYWATESYTYRVEGFGFFDPITIEKIKGDDVILPRVRKTLDEQSRRVKDKAEVFTPAWICNAQNNLVDDAWFGIDEAFNREFVTEDGRHDWEPTGRFKESFGKPKSHKLKSWIQYVKDRRLEITCGEAPDLMSRYDAVSGVEIPVGRCIGMFNRKMQVINAFEDDPQKWMPRTTDAIKATYGFEWQGDSLLARESIYVSQQKITSNQGIVNKYKVTISNATAEHAGTPDKSGKYRIISNLRILPPNEVCTLNYSVIYYSDSMQEAEACGKYLISSLVRYLMLITLASQHISRATFRYVPLQDFTTESDIDWSAEVADIDRQLYAKYGLDPEEIAFIERMVKPM